MDGWVGIFFVNGQCIDGGCFYGLWISEWMDGCMGCWKDDVGCMDD